MIKNKVFFYSKLIFYSLVFTNTSQAGVSNSDLEISVNYDESSVLSFGDIGSFSITITNNGPDDAGLNSPLALPIIVFTSEIEIGSELVPEINFRQANIPQDCFFIATIIEPLPGEFPRFSYEFDLPVIPAGQSITCYGEYQIGFSSGQRNVTWEIFNFFDTDPDPTNNTFDMVFVAQPPVVPTLSIWGIVVMILAMTYISKSKLKSGLCRNLKS